MVSVVMMLIGSLVGVVMVWVIVFVSISSVLLRSVDVGKRK